MTENGGDPEALPVVLAKGESARTRNPGVVGSALAALAVAALIWGGWADWDFTVRVLTITGWTLFTAAAAFRLAALMTPCARQSSEVGAFDEWPRYTVVVALYREAKIVGQLIERLSCLDYPAGKLECLLALEADDAETITAARAAPRPDWLKIVVVPDGRPRTKPRALNHALKMAKGDLIAIYDAEDAPDPDQIKAAAMRFAAGDDRLACLQAPLRIRRQAGSRTPFLDRQFAAEYAALFEVMLPALARWGLPFPLGGTSNHFKVEALRSIGAWDAWNVTEDADLGFRLWRRGYRFGVIAPATWESPPGAVRDWLPQRTRWFKGYMQTLIVHLRRPWALGARGLIALMLTIGLGLLSAAVFAPIAAWMLLTVLAPLSVGQAPSAPLAALVVLASGALTAMTVCWIGSRRAGVPYGPGDALLSLSYWPLLSLAFVHALWRLIGQPHHWDKTEHRPETASGPTPLPSPKADGDVTTVPAPHAHDKELV